MVQFDKSVNLAVIGAGYWGRKVIGEYLSLQRQDPNFKLVKVCDLLTDNLVFCKEKLHVEKDLLCSKVSDVFKSNNVDAVHICTPNETHYVLGSKALYSDKNVLIEKPMSLTTQNASNLCKIAESRGLTLQVGHIYRFNNAIKKVKELVDNNYLGEIFYLKMQWATLMPSQFNRDIIFDLGPHPVDIMNYLLDEWPNRVSCCAREYRAGTIEEVAFLTLEFDRNIIAHIELSWLQPGKVRELTIVGSKRTAVVDCVGQKIVVYDDNENSHQIDFSVNNTIFDEILHYVNSIRDQNNNKNPGSIGAGNVLVLETLKKSKIKSKFVNVTKKTKPESFNLILENKV